MRTYILICISFIGLFYSSLGFADKQKPNLLLNTTETSNQQPVCWYEDKRYSEGAILIMNNNTVVCSSKNPSYNNSELNWLILNDEGEIIYPTAAKTIRVN